MNKVGKTLYKMGSRGEIREWSISVGEKDRVPIYSVSHGQLDGKMQVTEVEVPKGKNLGRSNETSAKEQCLAEAKALCQKQIARKGYTETVPTEVPSLPMLAHKYKDFAHKINWPAGLSYKIDGIRCIVSIKNGKVKCTSRTGNELCNLEHITDELLKLNKDVIIDGELYSDLHPFEEIVSIVRKSKSEDPRMLDIYFYAFDIINNNTYHQRVVQLDLLISGMTNTKIVPWKIASSEERLLSYHKESIELGYEGTMIRNLDSKYHQNKRSYDLLKYKDFLEEEFVIIGWKTGKGKFANIPTFEMITKDNKVFEAVPKGTEEIRAEYLVNADSYIKAKATVRFFEYTADGIPRFPVMVGIRDYE
jgi:DNA ligase-1